jgi:hypothetical protein
MTTMTKSSGTKLKASLEFLLDSLHSVHVSGRNTVSE